MSSRLRTTFSAVLLATIWGFSAASAPARTAGQMVLVTPDGFILDHMPEEGEVTIQTNSRGEKVLIDLNGNLVATEIPLDRFRKLYDATGNTPVNQPVPEIGSNGDDGLGEDYFPEPPVASDNSLANVERNDLGDVTGAIPGSETDPLNGGNGIDQPMPDLVNPDPTLDQGTLPGEAQTVPSYPLIDLKNKSRAEITALQVFLDREGISPGVIDGKAGANVSKAVDAWQTMTGETLDYRNSEDILTRLGYSGGLPIIEYTITQSDAAGPYVASIPEDYSQKAMLPAMSYTSVTEALAERFHMDETYLKELNPGVDFTIPGTIIKVVNPGTPKSASVARIVADKARKQIFAYDAMGTLVSAYPATIGSSDTPSPSGVHAVSRIALDPNYTYNPKINFQQGNNTKVLTIQPGPNTPVGSVWIALDKPTYGIHGTPEPSKIGKSQSHGCIRLTNWDARELAKMVTPGVTVEFID